MRASKTILKRSIASSASATQFRPSQNVPNKFLYKQVCAKAPATVRVTSRQFATSLPRKENVTVQCPAFADSISEGDVKFEKAVGDQVSEDETVMEIETDKTSIPVLAPQNGTIVDFLVEDGDTVTPGTPLFLMVMGEAGAAAKKEAPKEEVKAPESTPVPVEAKPAEIKKDLGAAPPVSSKPISTENLSDAKPLATKAEILDNQPFRQERRVKMNRMRQRISQRLKDAQNTCALLTTFNEVDMTNIMQLRNQYKDAFLKKHGIKLGFMSAFAKASAAALVDSPVINAVIDDVTNEIVYRDFVDISIAVATKKGLVVPVVRNVENMNYFDIENTITQLGTKARDDKLTLEDMDGGTFTISNGGVFGSLMGTPIVNQPQSAILGMHGVFDRPVAINGKVEIRPMMYIALTYDHRLIDGRDAVTFLRKIKQNVEDPRCLLLNL